MKKLQVPYNLDEDCLSMYANGADYIEDIYFAASPEIFPTARVGTYKDNYLEQQFKLLAFCKYHNIRSAVLFNGVDNKLFDSKLDEMQDYIQVLVDNGLDVIVVANPILCPWIRTRFPTLSIRLSILSLEYTLPKIISLYETGYVDEICLPTEMNRDEDSIKELHELCPNLKLSTIVNTICRQSCPVYFWHQALYNSDRQKQDDIFMRQILESLDLLKDKLPNSFKQIAFILPEELDYYDKYFDGYKIEGRTGSTTTLEQRLEYFALRTNPTYINDMLTVAGCCNAPDKTKIEDLDKNGLKYRKNCKNKCWRCQYAIYCKNETIH